MSTQNDAEGTSPNAGTLYVVGTPIGNLEDVTLRALRVLREADLIAAEDTRRTRKLLSKYEINTPMVSYHEHNKVSKTPRLVSKLREGAKIALVSDAGMPGISDPGQDLIAAALDEQIGVTIVPGADSIISALVLSGLSTARFSFAGFLPRKMGERTARLKSILESTETAILFESPNRLVSLLKKLADLAPSRKLAVARELTKRFEEVVRGTTTEVAEHFKQHPPRGECVVVIGGHPDSAVRTTQPDSRNARDLVNEIMKTEGLTKREAMRKAAKALGIQRREVYRLLLDEDTS